MNSIKYVGMDVHAATVTIAVRNDAGKLIMEATLETQTAALVDFVRGLQGIVRVAFEEGIHATWLYSVLLPHVAQVVACDPRQLPRHKGEKKNDKIDARQLSEWLRLGILKPVYHNPAGLRTLAELVRSYLTFVSDTTRVMNRLKAIYRGGAIPTKGTLVYSPRFRQAWLDQLREPGVHRRAELLYAQLDLLLPLRREAKRSMIAESRKHTAQKVLRSIPTLGPVRAAVLMAVIQTPHRFRTKRKLWTYAGLGLVTRSSANYRLVEGQLTPSRKPALILGLNWNHNHALKALFKDAAATAVSRQGPFQEFYARRVAAGMDPAIARVTVARKLATLVLELWKKGECFNAEHLKPQAA
ncbi:MAG: IS110 family transposase [Terriglobia bacterium]